MDLFGIHFADPVWLLGVPILPFVLALAVLWSRRGHATLKLGNPRLVEKAPGFLSAELAPWAFRFLVAALCLVAAARPQAGKKKVEEKRPLTDIFVAFDVSTSMLAMDLTPNRVTAAKEILGRFLDQVEDVRLGLTVFARISFTQCPLTTDLRVVRQLLSKVDVHSVKVDGTAIGDALVSSLNRLQKGLGKSGPEKGPSLSQRMLGTAPAEGQEVGRHQAIILMTDGTNNAGNIDPLSAARLAAAKGVRIYAIGMGGDKSVPLVDPNTGRYAVDYRTGQLAMTAGADMRLLEELAKMTGGRAFKASDNRSLGSVLSEIARLEKRDVVTTTRWEYSELAAFFLLAAFLLLGLDLVLGATVLRTLP